MKRNLLLVVSFCFLFTGCTGLRSPDITREEWLNMSSHVFPKTTVNDVLTNAEKVMRTSDPSDVRVYHQQDKMVATRRYFIYAVFAAVGGNFIFDLTAKQQGDDVATQLLISNSLQPITPMITAGQGGIGGTAGAGMVSGSQIPWRESYDLFYGRLESLLYNKPWVTCDAFRKDTKSVYTESLCMLADDNIPDGVKLSELSAKMLADRKAAEEQSITQRY